MQFGKYKWYVYYAVMAEGETYHSPIVSQLLLCDGQVCLLVQQLFDFLHTCAGRHLVAPQTHVLMTNCQPRQPEEQRYTFSLEEMMNCVGCW